MKFLIQTQPPYNLYQNFIWVTKNNDNEKSRNKKYLLTARLDNDILFNFA
jgi:hypothetical protein